jgi:hypothetical protein
MATCSPRDGGFAPTGVKGSGDFLFLAQCSSTLLVFCCYGDCRKACMIGIFRADAQPDPTIKRKGNKIVAYLRGVVYGNRQPGGCA